MNETSLSFSLALAVISAAATSFSSYSSNHLAENKAKIVEAKENNVTAIFAMGCFWCAEADFEKVKGVIKVESGYIGGNVNNPSYEQVSAGGSGHYEAVLVTYDPKVTNYANLLKIFWRNIDPFDANGQFCDKGHSYKSAIFTSVKYEKTIATLSKENLKKTFNKNIETKILPKSTFYKAEEYHQDYYKKNPISYKYYRKSCGRDARLKEIWGK
ncbi:peptide-methionine (S)-S-oxide reductase [Sphingorhabdus lutea]|uniref:Peptide methionine sulfoxide reductase MsrA n=1 Tax=Sphingorhabdus lutea TaxID=1913578 RepID=A0A1L3JEX2_9SPHN|nr:peptide-methionine (S)-S-oxide reductase MsrA [Sphingorhabdus lutea]APG63687.1 peptide-methionine (S)-S-oxide reductase [Sphingorhabdus lutea]